RLRMMKAGLAMAVAALIACTDDEVTPSSANASTASEDQGGNGARAVLANDIRGAAENDSEWLSHGRTYAEDRFSPLSQVNRQNISELGVAWYFDLDTDRGQEATPLVIDGDLYFTSAWS